MMCSLQHVLAMVWSNYCCKSIVRMCLVTESVELINTGQKVILLFEVYHIRQFINHAYEWKTCFTMLHWPQGNHEWNFPMSFPGFHPNDLEDKNDQTTVRISSEDTAPFRCIPPHAGHFQLNNKANLRDFIAATGLIILFKFDPNHRFFSPCDLEIWWMTSKIFREHLLCMYYFKLCASFQIHQWIQTEVTVWKRSIRVKIGNFLSRVTLKFDGWPWKTIGHLFYTTSSFVHHLKAMGELKLELQSGNA